MSVVFLSCFALIIAIIALGRAMIDQRAYRRQIELLHEKVGIAESQLRKRAQLADEIAHEIKNPLTAILCSAETLDLLVGNKLESLHRQSLGYIREYGDHLLRLVSDYLDVSRVEAQQLKSSPRSIKVEDTIKSVLGLLQSKSYATQVVLKYSASNPNLTAYIDPQHLKQIIFNLVHNALKFTQSGGEVHVTVSDELSSNFISLVVEDNGRGIPSAELQHIFDPYVHREKGDSVEVGTGLGLALCKSLVELAGGRITVKSWMSIGTVFEVLIPKGGADITETDDEFPWSSDPTFHSDRDNSPLLGQSYLVCDSDPVAREAIARLIEAWGGLVDRAEESVSAVRALAEKSYDAVMVENADSGDALALLSSIRAELSDDQTRVIITCSGPIDPVAKEQCGEDIVLEKPLNGSMLLRSLLQSNT